MDSYRMSFVERAADDGCGLMCQVLVDDEERRADAVARQHVEQLRRGLGVGTVIKREIDGWRRRPRHSPDRLVGDVEKEWKGCDMRQHDRTDCYDESKHAR